MTKKSLFRNRFAVAIPAGLAAFIWSWLSWTALPFHNQSLHQFEGESSLASAIQRSAPKDGLYIIPWCNKSTDQSPEEQEAAYKETAEKMNKGPVVFATVRPNGIKFDMGTAMGMGLFKDVITAFLLIWLLGQARALKFWEKIIFVEIAVLAGAIVSILPNAIWWGATSDVTILTFVDLVIGWGFGGAVIAKFAK